MNDAAALQRLLDIEAIRTLKHRYIRCMTQSRWSELEDLLTPDVQTSYSDGKYCFSGRDELLQFLRASHDAGQHHILGYWHVTMPEIDFQAADEATGIWAMYHFFVDKGARRQLEMFAYYEDAYRRDNDRWRIARTGYRRVMEQTFVRSELPSLELLVG